MDFLLLGLACVFLIYLAVCAALVALMAVCAVRDRLAARRGRG